MRSIRRCGWKQRCRRPPRPFLPGAQADQKRDDKIRADHHRALGCLQALGIVCAFLLQRRLQTFRPPLVLNDFLDKVLREELVEELVEDAVEAVKELAEEKQSARSALTEFVEDFAEEQNLPDVREVVRKALVAVERELKERELEEEEEFVVLTLLFS